MNKLLLETFEDVNLTDRQKKLFADVYVERVVVTKAAKTIDTLI